MNFYEMNKMLEFAKAVGAQDPVPLSQIPLPAAKAAVVSGQRDNSQKDDVSIVNEGASGPVADLRPTQNQLKPSNFVGMIISSLLGQMDLKDMNAIVSKDNAIMDGHHRWAAALVLDPNQSVNYVQIDLPKDQLITLLNVYTKGKLGNQGKAAEEAGGGAMGIKEAFEAAKEMLTNALEEGLPGKFPKTKEQVAQAFSKMVQGTSNVGNTDKRGNPTSFTGQPGVSQQSMAPSNQIVSQQASSTQHFGPRLNEMRILAGINEQDIPNQQQNADQQQTVNSVPSQQSAAQAGLASMIKNIDTVLSNSKLMTPATNLPRTDMPVIEVGDDAKKAIGEFVKDLKAGNIDYNEPYSNDLLNSAGKTSQEVGAHVDGGASRDNVVKSQNTVPANKQNQKVIQGAVGQQNVGWNQPVQNSSVIKDGPVVNEWVVLAGLSSHQKHEHKN